MNKPRIIFWETTKQCNLKCAFCRVVEKNPAPELNTQEAFKLINDIKRDFGETLLILSGGEPFLRKDIFDILGHAQSQGIKTSLATNGTLLNAARAIKLKETGVKRVSISLDSSREEAHDDSRKIAGSFKKALDACALLYRHNIMFQINHTITKANKDEIYPIADLALSLGAVAVHYFVMVPVGCGMQLKETSVLNAQEVDEVMRNIKNASLEYNLEIRPTCAPQYVRYADKGSRGGCLAGTKVFFVSAEGNIYPCGYLPIKAGSLRENNIADIWENSDTFKELRQNNLKGSCGACSLKNTCKGCRARAFSETGDYMHEDTSCVMSNVKCQITNVGAPRSPERSEGNLRGEQHGDGTKDNELLLALQQEIPITQRPYRELANKLGITETEVISKIKQFKQEGLIKRMDFRLDFKKLGIVSTLVACKIPTKEITKAREIILNCENASHNYLRKHNLNMWFTLSAGSIDLLQDLLINLKRKLGAQQMLSFKTKRTFKLQFQLKCNNEENLIRC